MKLSLKIFLGIFIPAMASIILISAILIDKNFNTNLEMQKNNYLMEYKNVTTRINNLTISNNLSDNLFKQVIDSFSLENTYFSLYKNDELRFKTLDLDIKNKKVLNLDIDTYNVMIEKHNNKYYSFIVYSFDGNYKLVYIKDITNVYNERNNFIKLCSIIVGIVSLLIILIAVVISKTLTKPLINIKKEMNKLSSGDYKIKVKEGKDEIGMVAIEFNKMSKELEKRNNDLLELINSKQLFIDNLSHEMNTPLTTISGYSTLLMNAKLDEEQKIEFLTYIYDETKRISEMYKKLLIISYKENTNIEKIDLELNDILNDLKEELKFKLQDKNIELIINNEIKTIKGDKTLISLAISNLIRNAINASDNNSTITVNTYEENNKKYIQVIDKGRGIEQSQIDKILEPFYRIDKDRSRKNGGTGLGLSIVTRVMDLHDGKLNISSELGKGSTFSLEFPE